jgi:hypothetical protein
MNHMGMYPHVFLCSFDTVLLKLEEMRVDILG